MACILLYQYKSTQMNVRAVESNRFGFSLLRATCSTNQMQNQNQSWLGRTRFPAFCAGYVYLLRVLIGLFYCLRLLWLVIVIASIGFGFTTLKWKTALTAVNNMVIFMVMKEKIMLFPWISVCSLVYVNKIHANRDQSYCILTAVYTNIQTLKPTNFNYRTLYLSINSSWRQDLIKTKTL